LPLLSVQGVQGQQKHALLLQQQQQQQLKAAM
jgi:hypothetical protein